MNALALALALAAPLSQEPAARKLTAAPDRRVELDLQHYYKPSELTLWLNSLATAYPEYLRLESMGKSAHGEELWVMTVAELDAGDPAARPALMVVGALGREDLFGTEMALATILELVQNHARDEQVSNALRRSTIYIAPSINPDLRGRVFAELEGASPASTETPAIELDRNFPIGWDPEHAPDSGAYPLAAPESRALAEFMLGHPNIALVQRYEREHPLRGGARADVPVADLELAHVLATNSGARGIGDFGPSSGSWLDFAYGQLGCLTFSLVTRGPNGDDVLPPVDALFQMARDTAPRTLRLASALPRLELGEPTVERLRADQWQVRVAVKNVGTTPTQTELGREHFACASPKLALDGARVVAASIANQPLARPGASIALPELAPTGECEASFFVTAAEGAELVLTASSPRAGVASKRVTLH